MSNNNGVTQSYANDRGSSSGDAEVGVDPASGSFFSADYKRHEDLKTMLDGNKDNLKLEAMKRIIGMVAKGKDASDLFPAVVKNVVSKNIEVKKLVYVYLVRYAEEQQDLALLSISTFQRGLKDPNQLIRASALRVLSSIRVPVIVPIMMLAIKESVSDMSPFVRKTAAHAIPKLYSLDPEQKEFCIEVIQKLLSDKTTLVIGSAVMAFEEVCPEQIELIHKNYRKLCNLLVDVEEWGQLVIINMLTRYARTQFVNPNKYGHMMDENSAKAFYDSEGSDSKSPVTPEAPKTFVMDSDHRLLLRNSKPLLQSRNASIVMAVAQLYHHVAPKTEIGLVAKPLVRLLRSHREVQTIVLSCIATMSISRKSMFEPYLKSFFVRPMDPSPVKLLKLEILTNLATDANIGIILREFHTYVTSSDKDFVAATIEAIGRCASAISDCTDTCMNGLVSLMSNRDEAVVAESVVVIRKLLQMEPSKHKDIIVHMAKLVDKITVPMARASILWLIGEYSERVPKIAPDVLRKVAKNFINETDIVKLQILNLATKLYLTNPKQTQLLSQYVFSLAKYDQNYDIRDRARFLRQMAFPNEKSGALAKHAKKIFLSSKPAPVLDSKFKDRDQFQLGTLSHFINSKATGYQELPEWPETAPDPLVRNVEMPVIPQYESSSLRAKRAAQKAGKAKKQSFYTDTEESESEGSTLESSSGETSSDVSESGSESSADEEEEGKSVEGDKESSESDTSSSSDEYSSTSESESSDESEPEVKPSKKLESKKVREVKKPTAAKESLLLLDFDDTPSVPASNLLQPTTNLIPTTATSALSEKSAAFQMSIAAPAFVSNQTRELLNRIHGNGLSINYRFTRNLNIYSRKMVSVELTMLNNGDNDIKKICISNKKLQSGMDIHAFPEIDALPVNQTQSVTVGIDYADTTQPAVFDIKTQERTRCVSLPAPVGEQLLPIIITESDFNLHQGKLKGMNENTSQVETEQNSESWIKQKVYEAANVIQVPSTVADLYKFAGRTLSCELLVLVSVGAGKDKLTVTVNCEKMVIGSMLLKEIKNSMKCT